MTINFCQYSSWSVNQIWYTFKIRWFNYCDLLTNIHTGKFSEPTWSVITLKYVASILHCLVPPISTFQHVWNSLFLKSRFFAETLSTWFCGGCGGGKFWGKGLVWGKEPLPEKSFIMPNLRDKFERGKENLSTKIQTGKEKISAGGKKLKLKVTTAWQFSAFIWPSMICFCPYWIHMFLSHGVCLLNLFYYSWTWLHLIMTEGWPRLWLESDLDYDKNLNNKI